MSIIDSPFMKPIQAIVSFSVDGKIKPLYLCIDGVTLKVNTATRCDNYGQVEFACEVIDGEYMKTIKVSYHKRENIWAVKRTDLSV